MNKDRIKSTGIKEYRQQNKPDFCPILGIPLAEEDAVLDHDHKTGRVRGVMHRQANVLVGKIENQYRRYMGKIQGLDLASVLENVAAWVQDDYSHMPLHPKGVRSVISKFRNMPKLDQVSFLESVNVDPAGNAKERVKKFAKWIRS